MAEARHRVKRSPQWITDDVGMLPEGLCGRGEDKGRGHNRSQEHRAPQHHGNQCPIRWIMRDGGMVQTHADEAQESWQSESDDADHDIWGPHLGKSHATFGHNLAIKRSHVRSPDPLRQEVPSAVTPLGGIWAEQPRTWDISGSCFLKGRRRSVWPAHRAARSVSGLQTCAYNPRIATMVQPSP
jgi:hypothetical protein